MPPRVKCLSIAVNQHENFKRIQNIAFSLVIFLPNKGIKKAALREQLITLYVTITGFCDHHREVLAQFHL